ncbi:MAG: outer membrane protein assembly factor BamB family protein [Halobacteriota archaeon]
MLFAGLIAVPGAAQSDTVQARYDAAHTADYSSVAGSTQPNDKLLWSVAVGEGASGDPTVANGVVYVTGGGAYNGTLYALNTATGLYKWKFPTGEYSMSSPAVSNGIVYVGTANGTLYALNATTGAKLWNTSVKVPSFAAVSNGIVYVGSTDGNLYALNATTGAKLWNYSAGDTVASSPAVANGIVYWGGNNSLNALNATTGARLWNYTVGMYGGTPAVANGLVYFTASVPDKGNLLYAIGNASAATAQGRSSIPGFEVGIAVIALIIGALVASKKR